MRFPFEFSKLAVFAEERKGEKMRPRVLLSRMSPVGQDIWIDRHRNTPL
jgi:hypothetical protein